MKTSHIVELVRDSITAFTFNDHKISLRKCIATFLAFLFNIISTVFHISSLELLKNIIKTFYLGNNESFIYKYILYTIIYLLFRCFYKMIYSYFTERSIRNLMVKGLKNTMKMPYKDFIKSDSGKLVANIQTRLVIYKSVYEILFYRLPSILIFIIFSFSKIYNNNSNILYMILIFYPIIYFYISFNRLSPILKYHTSYLNEKINNSSILYDKIQNFELIKSYGIEDKQCDEFYSCTDNQRKQYFNMKLESEKRNILTEYFSEFPFIAIILLCLTFLPYETLNISVVFMILKALNTLLKQTSELISSLAISLNSLDELIETPVDTLEKTDLVFNHCITFEYINIFQDNKKILRDINLNIPKNSKIAIIGKNGTGKSTFIKTLLRFTVYEGNILIDGKNINKVDNESLFNIISYVSQDDYISDTSIINNVRMGNKNITIDEIVQMAKFLGIHSEIMKMKNGYFTIAGFNGCNLSAGQRKKISILRAFIKNSPILILDEATSTVDKKYEDFFIKNVLNEIKNKTIMMIIHQKELIKYFEKVIYLENGKVAEYGDYEKISNKSKGFREYIKGKSK